jgi:hypothetical protein
LLIGYSIAIVLPKAEIVRRQNSVASQSPCQMIHAAGVRRTSGFVVC